MANIKKLGFFLALLLLVGNFPLWGATNRSQAPLGLYLGLGNPYVSDWSGNIAYNINNYSRISLGRGEVNRATHVSKTILTTTGGQVFFFLPWRNLSPAVGLGHSIIKYKVIGIQKKLIEFEGEGKTSVTALSFGIDWTSANGFHAAFGFHSPLERDIPRSIYFNIGLFL